MLTLAYEFECNRKNAFYMQAFLTHKLLKEKIMKKQITTEKLEKLKQKESKELAKWQRIKSKKKPNAYIWYLLLICTVVFLADELCSNLEGNMKTIIATVLFEPVFGAETAVAKMNLFAFLPYMFYGWAFLYKPLADRFGRKPFIVINTIGMGLGMIVIGLATNIPVYLVGSVLTVFFTPHDMQAVYILESAPDEHRAKYYAVSKSVASLGVMILPVLRNLFVKGVDPSLWQWRYVYLIPSIVAFVIAIIALICLRETDVFVDMRIKQLSMTEEERKAAKENKKKEQTSRGGLFDGIKFIAKNKQLRWLALALGIITIGGNIGTNYEPMLTFGYAKHLLNDGIALDIARNTASTEFVSKALVMLPIGSALVQLANGFISDRIGRKKCALTMLSLCIASFILAYIGAEFVWNVYLVGLFTGIVVGSVVAANDSVSLVVAESTPTNLRSSTSAAFPIISGMLSVIGILLCTVLQNIFGDIHIGMILLVLAVPSFAIGLLILLFKTKETKGTNLEEI